MRRIERILLAIQPARPGRVELRACLLGPELDIDTFDVLALRRASAGARKLSTAYRHLQLDGRVLGAVGEGQRRDPGATSLLDADKESWPVQSGSPAQLVARTAERIGACLTLVAGSSRPLLPQWGRPSGTAELIRLHEGALLMVRAEARRVYRSVVVATDLSRASLCAARIAALLAPSARFVFVHVCQLPDELTMRETGMPARAVSAQRGHCAQAARARLDAFIDLFLHQLPHGAREVQIGLPSEVIKQCAQRHDADLVVVGRGATHPGARLSCSNVMQRLVDDGGCDLLVGPGAGGNAGGQRQAA